MLHVHHIGINSHRLLIQGEIKEKVQNKYIEKVTIDNNIIEKKKNFKYYSIIKGLMIILIIFFIIFKVKNL